MYATNIKEEGIFENFQKKIHNDGQMCATTQLEWSNKAMVKIFKPSYTTQKQIPICSH